MTHVPVDQSYHTVPLWQAVRQAWKNVQTWSLGNCFHVWLVLATVMIYVSCNENITCTWWIVIMVYQRSSWLILLLCGCRWALANLYLCSIKATTAASIRTTRRLITSPIISPVLSLSLPSSTFSWAFTKVSWYEVNPPALVTVSRTTYSPGSSPASLFNVVLALTLTLIQPSSTAGDSWYQISLLEILLQSLCSCCACNQMLSGMSVRSWGDSHQHNTESFEWDPRNVLTGLSLPATLWWVLQFP